MISSELLEVLGMSDRILVNAGGPIVALKKTDGSQIWRSNGEAAGYSSAVLHEFAGVPQAIFFTAYRALGVSVREYRELEAGAQPPSFETWDRICKLFGWPQTFLETGTSK